MTPVGTPLSGGQSPAMLDIDSWPGEPPYPQKCCLQGTNPQPEEDPDTEVSPGGVCVVTGVVTGETPSRSTQAVPTLTLPAGD